MNKYIFLFVCIIFTHEMSFAQESSVWDIKRCVDYALENNLNVKQSYSNVQIDEITLHQARMNRLPSMNGSISYGSRWGRSIDPTSNLFITQKIGFTTGSLSSNVVLFGGLRNSYSISQSEKFLESTKYSYDAERNNVILNVVTFYTNVILNQELYENAKAQLENTQQQLERTQKQVNAGALPISNLLEIQAQAATNELNLVNQENALNLSMLQLKQVMQLSSSEIITIEVPELIIENEIILEYNIDEVYAMALQTMPEIRSAESFYEASEIGTKVSKGSLYPTLSLFAGLNSNYSTAADRLRFLPDGGVNVITNPEIGYVSGTGTPVLSNSNFEVPTGRYIDGYIFKDQMSDNLSKSLSLNLNIPIFGKFFNRDEIQKSMIREEQASINLERAKNELRQVIERAYNDVLASAKSYSVALKQVEAREESFRVTQQRYNLGAADYFAYQLAETDLYRSKSDLLRMKYDFIFKKNILDFYMGNELDF